MSLSTLLGRKSFKAQALHFESKAIILYFCRSDDASQLKFCGTCRMACYCGAECQQGDWKVHKLLHREIKNYAGSVMV